MLKFEFQPDNRGDKVAESPENHRFQAGNQTSACPAAIMPKFEILLDEVGREKTPEDIEQNVFAANLPDATRPAGAPPALPQRSAE